MPTSNNFAWINFRERPGLKNFAWIYFREDKNFEKYFSFKKRKTTFLSIESFYKSSKNYKYVNKFYMLDPWKRQKHYAPSSSTYSSSLSGSYRSLTSKFGKFERMYFLNHPISISSIADEFLKFISRGLFSRIILQKFRVDGLIFAKSQKIR